jgi:hypothetical protein
MAEHQYFLDPPNPLKKGALISYFLFPPYQGGLGGDHIGILLP